MVTKTQAIKNFLAAKAPPDLALAYSADMECQVNVGQDGGDRVEGEYKGKAWSAWTDGNQTWKNFRIPLHANTAPEYEDREIKFDLEAHAEGIGLTGWDWKNCKSRWVAFDFDAIVGHSDKHQQKLADTVLQSVQDEACKIPWVTVRRSTSGNGLHLYVFVDVDTENHTEHAALARAILSKMSAIAGFDFNSKVDNCGSNIWVWHRKFEKAGGKNGPGLKLIKQGERLTEIPPNWRDHIKVTSGARKRNKPTFVGESEVMTFEEFCGQQNNIPLDEEHKALMNYLDEIGAMWWFDTDHHMMVCHTHDLKRGHEALGMRGIFETKSTGREHGVDQNCFAFPLRKGGWVIRRHTPGIMEHESWDQDASGWTRCYLNKEPDLKTAARSLGGNENEKGGFVFREAEVAGQAAQKLGAIIDIPRIIANRPATIKPHKDGRLIFEVGRAEGDPTEVMKDWTEEKGKWKKILNIKMPAKEESEVGNYDDLVRHLVSHAQEDCGWVVKSDGNWSVERLEHVKAVLLSLGLTPKDVTSVLGSGVLKKWTLVSKPFAPEYPGDRQWNRNAPQLAYSPSQDLDNLNYPTWNLLLAHIGKGLDAAVSIDPWCQTSFVKTGADYLRCWVASLFQNPMNPLPYLFLYSEEQETGKSTFHMALDTLMDKGVMRADASLTSQQGFNAELENIVLCVIEETDLRSAKSRQAYDRIKDWVTSNKLLVHKKGKTPYSAPNSTHWIQCSNNISYCPMFPGDTRITMIRVEPLTKEQYIDDDELFSRLIKEAPDFLAAILNLELPQSNNRLGIPVVVTDEKKVAQKAHQNDLESFLDEATFPVPGECIKLGELYDRFIEWLDPNQFHEWGKIKMGKSMPLQYPKGRLTSDEGQWYFGNISWQPAKPGDTIKKKFILVGQELVQEP